MFVRKKPISDNKIKIQIVRFEKTGAKVRQKILRHVGTAHGPEEVKALEALGQVIIDELKAAQLEQLPLVTSREFAKITDCAQEAEENPWRAGVDVAECHHAGQISAGIRQAFGAV